MNQAEYDVVVLGAGVAGALVAKTLTRSGLRVLLLEAGPATAETIDGYEGHLDHFYGASGKGPESAWPPDPNAPQPDTADLRFNNGYFVQNGPQLYGSSYTRVQGGSTLHWLGVSLRMLPEDFELRSKYGVGRDWPLRYGDIEPYYRKAEYELGVAADVADQKYQGLEFPADYEFPMARVPQSYSDLRLAELIEGLTVTVGDHAVPLQVRSYPAARNSIPRGDYRPIGAIDRRADGRLVERFLGGRCQGNTSCTPICPVQAKYNAQKTLALCDQNKLTILSQAVGTRVNIDPATGRVRSITYKRYDGATHTEHEARGRVFVLAAHAVENAKIMLLSGLHGTSGLVGANLMDHPALYAWGLAPEPVWPFRGPLSTSGIEELRSGPFRAEHAAFRFDVGNDGWKATTGAPDATVVDAVMRHQRFGRALREELESMLSRQVRLSLAIEQLPDPANRVTLDRRFLDPLGTPRPAVSYRLDDYTCAGMVAATKVYKAMFRHARVTDYTNPDESNWFPTVQHGGKTFHYHGMGHFAGTHLMGDDPRSSVVDHHQRTWDHNNLFLVGSGSFPTMGTSNPTLTLAALAIRTAEHLAGALRSGSYG
jgi:choline dehydrogenase-like flavoprotein